MQKNIIVYGDKTFAEILADSRTRRETKIIVRIGGHDTTINGDSILSLTSTSMLYDEYPAIGNAIAGEMTVSAIFPGPPDRGSHVNVLVRLVLDSDHYTGWIPSGDYHIDTRSTDVITGVTTLHCYDALIKADKLWDHPTGAANLYSFVDASELILDAIGITYTSDRFYEALEAMDDAGYKVLVPAQTEDREPITYRRVAAYLGAALNGNIFIDEEGALDYAPFAEQEDEIDVGMQASSFLVGGSDSFSKVITTSLTGYEQQTGTDAHAVIRIDKLLWASIRKTAGGNEAIASRLLTALSGVTYQAYEASNVVLDPRAQLGDALTIAGHTVVISKKILTYGAGYLAELAAPDFAEQHEYAPEEATE